MASHKMVVVKWHCIFEKSQSKSVHIVGRAILRLNSPYDQRIKSVT